MSLVLPGARNVYQDQALTTVAESYIPDPMYYIAGQAFPDVPVPTPTGTYYSWSLEDLARIVVERVAEGAPTPEINLPNVKLPYDVEDPFGAKIPVTFQEGREADFDVFRRKTMFLMDNVYKNREREFVALVDAATSWSSNETPTTKWSAPNSTPINDVETAKVAIHGRTGFVPNTIVTSYAVASALWNNTQIRTRLDPKDTEGVRTSNEDLARIFGVSKFLVSKGVQNTAKRGADKAIASFLGSSLIVMHVTDTPSRDMPSAGYCFYDAKYSGGEGMTRVTRWEQDDPERTWIRAQQRFIYHRIAADLGYRYHTVL